MFHCLTEAKKKKTQRDKALKDQEKKEAMGNENVIEPKDKKGKKLIVTKKKSTKR